MKTMKLRIKGMSPLLMHNGLLADPSNPFTIETKKITSKRKKVDADHEALAKLEFLGSLYTNEKEAVIIPANMLTAVIINGAKHSKLGKVFQASVFADKNALLEYEGPKEPLELWKDESFRFKTSVVVNRSRIMRTRPIFNEWAVTVEFSYLDNVEESEIITAMEKAGQLVGIGDWRPRYGRFSVEVVK